MTREEIIDGLEIYTVGRMKKDMVHITVEELQKFIDGIKTLEQESYDELDFVQTHKKMPVTLDLTPCDDAISRQAAIKAFQMFREYEFNRSNKEWVNRIETVLNQLPPVTPQYEDIAKAFQFGLAIGFGERYDETDRVMEELKKVCASQTKTGQWIRMSDLSEKEDNRYKCSCCGNVVYYKNKMDLYTFNSWCNRCGSNNRIKNWESEE